MEVAFGMLRYSHSKCVALIDKKMYSKAEEKFFVAETAFLAKFSFRRTVARNAAVKHRDLENYVA